MARKVTRETVAAAIASALDTLSGRDVAPAIVQNLDSRYKGSPVPDDDVAFYVTDVAKRMGVTESSFRQRKADITYICASYTDLPTAMEKYQGKGKAAPAFYIAARLANKLRTMSVTKAVSAVKADLKPKKPVDPADRDEETARKSAKTHVKRILEQTALPGDFRSRLAALAAEFQLT
jgi:hypothetical protein